MPESHGSYLPESIHGKSAVEVAQYAVVKAGKILQARFGKMNRVQIKGRRNLVTEADLKSEAKILQILKEEFPEHSILSEEAGASGIQGEYNWIIDPLDGTNNFHFGIPFFCINIALAKKEEVILGVTYDPVRNEMFYAVKGQGTYLNGKKCSVTHIDSLAEISVGVDLGYVPDRSKELLDIVVSLWTQVHCLRLMGSSALGLAYVSCGRLGLYFHKYIYPWDIASGLLLVRESGGEINNFTGANANINDREIIAANKDLLQKFTEWLAKK